MATLAKNVNFSTESAVRKGAVCFSSHLLTKEYSVQICTRIKTNSMMSPLVCQQDNLTLFDQVNRVVYQKKEVFIRVGR